MLQFAAQATLTIKNELIRPAKMTMSDEAVSASMSSVFGDPDNNITDDEEDENEEGDCIDLPSDDESDETEEPSGEPTESEKDDAASEAQAPEESDDKLPDVDMNRFYQLTSERVEKRVI